MLPELFQQRRLHMRHQNFLPFQNELGILDPAENFPRALHGKGVAVVPQEFHDCLVGVEGLLMKYSERATARSLA